VIGGVAMAAYGMLRTTVDLDFVVAASATDDLLRFMESRGYETLRAVGGYSNHRHPDPLWGRVDFMYVSGETADKLFANCRAGLGPRGQAIPLPKPEHLAAMKALAIKNDPGRLFQDLADIRFLLALDGVDRAEIRSYLDRHGVTADIDGSETG
jgi:hypothetical protein